MLQKKIVRLHTSVAQQPLVFAKFKQKIKQAGGAVIAIRGTQVTLEYPSGAFLDYPEIESVLELGKGDASMSDAPAQVPTKTSNVTKLFTHPKVLISIIVILAVGSAYLYGKHKGRDTK